jgi:hypothetical protein
VAVNLTVPECDEQVAGDSVVVPREGMHDVVVDDPGVVAFVPVVVCVAGKRLLIGGQNPDRLEEAQATLEVAAQHFGLLPLCADFREAKVTLASMG